MSIYSNSPISLTVAVIAFSSLLAGCKSSPKTTTAELDPMYADIRSLKFEPIGPPSSLLEPGTVFTFDNQVEQLRAARNKCSTSVIQESDKRGVAVLSRTYRLSRESKLDLNILSIAKQYVDIKALAELGSEFTVEYKFLDPFVWAADEVTVVRHFKSSPEDCAKAAVTKGSFVVHQVLGAKGIEIKFSRSKGGGLVAAAEVKQVAKADLSSKAVSVGDGSIKLDAEVFYGYRVFRGFLAAGVSESRAREAIYVTRPDDEATELRSARTSGK